MRPSWVSVQNSRVVYLSALYRRIAARRGAKRAVMAVAHALLVIAFTCSSARRTIGNSVQITLTVSMSAACGALWSGGWNVWDTA
jgi:hypothetical protein